MDRLKPICPLNFSKVGGIKIKMLSAANFLFGALKVNNFVNATAAAIIVPNTNADAGGSTTAPPVHSYRGAKIAPM